MFLSSLIVVKICELTTVTTTLLIGAILSGSGLILTSVVQDFNALYFVYGVLFGVGSSFLYTPCLITIGKWFHKYQAVTTGVACASAAFGAVVLCPLMEFTIRVNGLRKTLQCCGIVYLTVAVLCSLCFKPLKNNDAPIQLKQTEKFFIENDKKKTTQRRTSTKKLIFKNKCYLMFLLAMMITNFSYYIPIVHLVSNSSFTL